MKYSWHFIAFLAGGAIAVQAVVNAALRLKMNHPLQAVLVSFGIGTVATIGLCFANRQPWPQWQSLAREPWWIWLGGLLGVLYVGTSMVATPRVGAALMLALGFAGQMVCAVAIDHYGFFGMERRPINPGRVLGVACLLLGVVALAVSAQAPPIVPENHSVETSFQMPAEDREGEAPAEP